MALKIRSHGGLPLHCHLRASSPPLVTRSPKPYPSRLCRRLRGTLSFLRGDRSSSSSTPTLPSSPRWIAAAAVLLKDEGAIPSPEDEKRREKVIRELKKIVMHWAKAVAHEQSVPQRLATATVLTYGSYTLGVIHICATLGFCIF